MWLPDGWLATVDHLKSPNFNDRPPEQTVDLLVVHGISLPPGQFSGHWVERFFLNQLDANAHPYFSDIADLQVSAHFYIRRGGKVIQFVGCDQRAWHAGQSSWQGRMNCNDYSIGVELAGSDDQPYTRQQYRALVALIAALTTRYPLRAIAGHSDIAPGRKTDPGPRFAWSVLKRCYPDFQFPEK